MKYFTRISVAMVYFTHWVDQNILSSHDFNLSQLIHGQWLEGQSSPSQVSCWASKITCKSTWITNSKSQANPQLLSTEVLLTPADLAAFFYLRLPCKKQRNAAELCLYQRNLHIYSHLYFGNLALPATPLLCITPQNYFRLRVYMSPENNKKHCTSFSVDEVSVGISYNLSMKPSLSESK